MSNIIYKNNSHHYVYQITEIPTNRKYIGVRTSKIEPLDDLGIKYFSSSKNKDFITNQKNNRSEYLYEILSIHESRNDAVDEEIRLHELYDVSNNPEFINRASQKNSGFDAKGKVSVKDKDGNYYVVSLDDPRYINGELKHVTTGMIPVKDKDGNTYLIERNDPRFMNGELIHVTHGLVSVKDKDGNVFSVSITDPRHISGELKHINHGRKLSDEHKEKISKGGKGLKRSDDTKNKIKQLRLNEPKIKCEYCNREYDKLNHKRWHGDKCKMKKGD